MAAHKNNMNFDRTEVCINYYGGKRPMILNLNVDRIISVQFDHGTKKKFLKSVPSDVITLTVRGVEEPFRIYAADEGEFFQSYIDGMRKFCKDNRLTLRDNL